MKNKKTGTVCLCLILSLCLALTGCAGKKSTATGDTATEGETLFGTVVSVDTDAKTITLTEMGQLPQGGSNGEMPEGGSGGEMPSGEMPEMPEGEMPQGGANGESGEAPQKPDGEMLQGGFDGESGEAPQMPDGEMPQGGFNGESGEAPQMPDGEMPEGGFNGESGQAPQMPDGEMPQGGFNGFGGESKTYSYTDATVFTDADGSTVTAQDLTAGSFVSYTLQGENLLTVTVTALNNNMGAGGPGGMGGGMGGGSEAPTEYTAVNHYTENTEIADAQQSSTGTDESICWVDGAAVTLTGISAERTSADSTGGDASSFYGVGAAYLVTSGSLQLSNSTVATDAAGGAGVFAYGDGVATVSDCVITTRQNTSGGIHVAGGGTLYAKNLTVTTEGESSAAIRSDRGSGVMSVDGGSYTSNGTGSPAVYSTANITVKNATLTATNSEAVCIEGKNSLKLTDCAVSCAMPDNSQNDTKWSVIVYQSMSGDSEVGTGSFEMTGGSLTSHAGGLFYTTNTQSTFTLQGVDIQTDATPDYFLRCTGNANQRGWGSSGANGAQCTFTAIKQVMNGDIIWDSISTLDFFVTKGSTLTGAVLQDESAAGNGGDGYANITVDADSVWVVTGDSVVTSLTLQGKLVDAAGNTVSVVGTDGTVYVAGQSSYTVTVQSFAA